MFFNDSASKIVGRPSRFSVLRDVLIEVLSPGFEVHDTSARSLKSMIKHAQETTIKVAN
jgi:hypothetical protein